MPSRIYFWNIRYFSRGFEIILWSIWNLAAVTDSEFHKFREIKWFFNLKVLAILKFTKCLRMFLNSSTSSTQNSSSLGLSSNLV